MTAPNLKNPTTITGKNCPVCRDRIRWPVYWRMAQQVAKYSRSTVFSAPMWMALMLLTLAFLFTMAATIVT
jgi:hypothetical protein